MTIRSAFSTAAALACLALVSSTASGQVTQLDGTPLPVAVGQAEYNLVTMSWGWNRNQLIYKDPMTGVDLNPPATFGDFYPTFEDGDAITLNGLFKWRGEQIDPVADAKTAPGYFSPQCGFTGSLVLLGGNCQVGFGWYNVDPNNPVKPTLDQIVEFIPNNIPEYMNCVNQDGVSQKTDGFCPLAWDNKLPQSSLQVEGWQPTSFDSGAITSNPAYAGGAVGFAVIGNPNNAQCPYKYSMAEFNDLSSSGEPWVTTLIYQSTVDPEGFYLAFEDLSMSAADWRLPATAGAQGMNDGDFNDFVFFISGIGCTGGGQVCDTGQPGACSLGRTDCAAEGQTGLCRPVVQPGNEICDNVDNDCNGIVDDGNLCSEGLVCDMGSCVAKCSGGEFVCPVGLSCENDHCVETACVGVVCEAGQACRGGTCQDACSGAVCPLGQECQLGRCVDPCAGVTCPANRVCERGLCVSDCACRGCQAGLTCQSDGRCGDPACAGVTCPDGQKCQLGSCVDLCEGVVCPGGAACVNGACQDPTMTGSGGSVSIDGGIVVTGGASSGSGGSNGKSSDGVGRRTAGQDPGCACRVGSDRVSSLAWLGLLAAVGAGLGRRRAGRRARS